MEWLDKPQLTPPIKAQPPTAPPHSQEVENVLKQIEEKKTDITAAYNDWVRIGFAFADKFGESGRSLFHRVSRFYPGYLPDDCDNQFNNCLKSNGHGVTLKTFFYLAKNAGLEISPKHDIEELSPLAMPENPSSGTKAFPLEESKEPRALPTFPDSRKGTFCFLAQLLP